MAKTVIAKTVPLRATSGKRTLKFGLVSVGISMGPALDDTARVSGKYVDPDALTPVKQQYVNEDGDVVKPIKAYPYGEQFIVLEEGEVPEADSSDVVELVANLTADEVPAEWVEKTYLTWPTDVTHDQGYALVSHYLRSNGRVFIGTTVSNGTTKAFALRWSEVYGCVVAQVLAYHAQVRWTNVELVCKGVASIPAPDAAMMTMAEQIFDGIADDFAWDEVEDEYGNALTKVIAEKALSGKVTAAASAAPTIASPDLMAALQASLAARDPNAPSDPNDPAVLAYDERHGYGYIPAKKKEAV